VRASDGCIVAPMVFNPFGRALWLAGDLILMPPSAQERRGCEMWLEAGGDGHSRLPSSNGVIQANPDMTEEQIRPSQVRPAHRRRPMSRRLSCVGS
jgi:hypothetical protein